MLLSDHWQLNPEIDFLNHGSFGACPRIVLQKQRDLIDELERDPIHYLAPERQLEPKLDQVRQTIGQLINAPSSDIAFVRNATDGVNAVLNSVPLEPLDEILITNHGYNACNNAARHVAEKTGAKVTVAEIPFPLKSSSDVITAIEQEITARTRLVLVDHVTSPTGLILPVKEIIALAHKNGSQVLVDGTHAAGMLPLNLATLAPDFYTANHHKWLCCPKASGFLFVKPELQDQIRPTVISHGANQIRSDRSRFRVEFDWTGTYDPTPILAVNAAIDFMGSLYDGGLSELYKTNRQKTLAARKLLCDELQIDVPSSDDMIGSLATIPLNATQLPKTGNPTHATDQLQRILYQEHGFELPIFQFGSASAPFLRISMQAYNELHQIERLAVAVSQITT